MPKSTTSKINNVPLFVAWQARLSTALSAPPPHSPFVQLSSVAGDNFDFPGNRNHRVTSLGYELNIFQQQLPDRVAEPGDIDVIG